MDTGVRSFVLGLAACGLLGRRVLLVCGSPKEAGVMTAFALPCANKRLQATRSKQRAPEAWR